MKLTIVLLFLINLNLFSQKLVNNVPDSIKIPEKFYPQWNSSINDWEKRFINDNKFSKLEFSSEEPKFVAYKYKCNHRDEILIIYEFDINKKMISATFIYQNYYEYYTAFNKIFEKIKQNYVTKL